MLAGRSVLAGADAIAVDGGLTQLFGGLQPVQALDQHKARAVLPHEDRLLQSVGQNVIGERIDARLLQRRAALHRHVDIRNLEGLAFQHEEEEDSRFWGGYAGDVGGALRRR